MEAKSEERSIDIQILVDIREAEKKADSILERAREDKESVMHDAVIEASKKFAQSSEGVLNEQKKKIKEFKEKSGFIREEKINEGMLQAKQIKAKSTKKIEDAANFITVKFEETLNA